MRTFDLGRAAANAEILRFRRMIARQINRAIYGAIAAVFALALLVMIHVVAYQLLLGVVTPLIAMLILLGFDLVVAGGFGFLASRGMPDASEIEARDLRDRSLVALRQSVAIDALAGPVGKLAWRAMRRSSRK